MVLLRRIFHSNISKYSLLKIASRLFLITIYSLMKNLFHGISIRSAQAEAKEAEQLNYKK